MINIVQFCLTQNSKSLNVFLYHLITYNYQLIQIQRYSNNLIEKNYVFYPAYTILPLFSSAMACSLAFSIPCDIAFSTLVPTLA